MRKGGSRGVARKSAAAVRQRALRLTRSPAFALAVVIPLVFVCAVGGSAPTAPGKGPAIRADFNPVAAVSPAGPDVSGPNVIAMERPPTEFHVAEGALSAPPPPMIVNAPGALGIPTIALSAYRNAELKMAVADPACGISWNLLAGIGRIESGHASNGAVDVRGTAVQPIYGPSLDGSLPGNEVIVSSTVGNRPTYARAMGPMQFLPGTWARYAADGDGDGMADPQNLFDATLTAARYLCSGGLNLRDASQVMAAILRYNNSTSYAQNVLGWASAYATGVVPVDLPPITGPPPPLGDAHDEHPEGLGPNLPMNVIGLPTDDPLSRMPLIDLTQGGQLPSQSPMFPWMTPNTPPQSQMQVPGCTVICIGPQSPAPGAAGPGTGIPQWLLQPPAVTPPADGAPPWAPQPPQAPVPPAPPAIAPPPDAVGTPPAGAPPAGQTPAGQTPPKASPSPKPAKPAPNTPAPAPAG